jgi:hypothetical protein
MVIVGWKFRRHIAEEVVDMNRFRVAIANWRKRIGICYNLHCVNGWRAIARYLLAVLSAEIQRG